MRLGRRYWRWARSPPTPSRAVPHLQPGARVSCVRLRSRNVLGRCCHHSQPPGRGLQSAQRRRRGPAGRGVQVLLGVRERAGRGGGWLGRRRRRICEAVVQARSGREGCRLWRTWNEGAVETEGGGLLKFE